MTTPRQRQIEQVLAWMDNTPEIAEVAPGSRGWKDNIHAWFSAGENADLIAWLVDSPPEADALITADIADIVVRRQPIRNVHVDQGRIKADDTTFVAVSGHTVVGVVVADDRSRLLAYIPFPGAHTAAGSDITISWHKEYGLFGVV